MLEKMPGRGKGEGRIRKNIRGTCVLRDANHGRLLVFSVAHRWFPRAPARNEMPRFVLAARSLAVRVPADLTTRRIHA